MSANYYKEGDFNRICDLCGFKVKASQTRKQWNNLIVCTHHWEPQNQQDFLKAKVDKQWVVDSRPDVTPQFTFPSSWLLTEDGTPMQTEDGQQMVLI